MSLSVSHSPPLVQRARDVKFVGFQTCAYGILSGPKKHNKAPQNKAPRMGLCQTEREFMGCPGATTFAERLSEPHFTHQGADTILTRISSDMHRGLGIGGQGLTDIP